MQMTFMDWREMDARPFAFACMLASLVAAALPGTAALAGSGAPALLAMAREAEAGDRAAAAALLYRRAHQADPFDPQPLRALGRIAMANGEAEEAERYFTAALAAAPGDREDRHGLAAAYLDQDRAEDALSLYDALLSQDAADARAWNGRGLALDLAGRHDEARAAWIAGLTVAPDDPGILANLDTPRHPHLGSAPPEPGTDRLAALALNTAPPSGTGAVLPPHSVPRDP